MNLALKHNKTKMTYFNLENLAVVHCSVSKINLINKLITFLHYMSYIVITLLRN